MLGKSKIITGRLDENVRIKVESEESFSSVRCSVLMLHIFENEHSHKYVDLNMEENSEREIPKFGVCRFFQCFEEFGSFFSLVFKEMSC